MAKHTTRDSVWTAALELALELDRFDLADVLHEAGLENTARRTTRDTLSTMADQGWLEKVTHPDSGHRLYTAGERLEALVDSAPAPLHATNPP